MTHSENIEEIKLKSSVPQNLFDAACEECGTRARFSTTGEQRILGETFERHCYSCNSGQFPGLGVTNVFRIVELHPDPDSPPNEPVSPCIYTTDDPE